MQPKIKYNICFVSEFFLPGYGGVEMHQFQLAQCLMKMGHKVICITKTYGNRQGIRYMTNGLKIYYIPFRDIIAGVIFPTILFLYPLSREILIREKIDIVHSHQSTATMGLEIHLLARSMGLKVMYTDHSLWGFGDAGAINLNKTIKIILHDSDACIAVSHTVKENLSLRAQLDPDIIYTIPNAVDATRFTPDTSRRFPLNTINIVILCRLWYRKGVDLLVDLIPAICQKYSKAYFIIGGDGPKRYLLEEMIDKYHLKNRIEMLGAIHPSKVRDVLVRGHLFINSSLTEAFCIAIVEAASCGLSIVTTNVGGIPEVLPEDMVYLADPNPESLIEATHLAIKNIDNIVPNEYHEKIAKMYSWYSVAERTTKVYDTVMEKENPSLLKRVKIALACGPTSGILAVTMFAFAYFLLIILEILRPAFKIEPALDFPFERYQMEKNLTDHSYILDHKTPSKN